jgi:flagellar hook-associated protein 2
MDIKDQSDFESLNTRNSQSGAINITTSATASAGTHSITVNSLAKAQRNLSSGFVNTSTAVSPTDITLSLSINGGASQPIVVAAAKSTPGGIVSAINSANLGVKAQIINTGEVGTPYRILISGATGRDSGFTLSSDSAAVDFAVGPTEPAAVGYDALKVSAYQAAANGNVVVNGVPIQPSKNQLTEVIPGVTVDLYTPTTGGAASVELVRDTTAVKTKMTALVKAYNDANTMLGVVSDPKSTVETYGATLVGHSIVNTVRTQLRSLITTDSSSKSGGLTALRDIGLSISKTGELELDATKLDASLQGKFEHVVTMLSANRENQSDFSVLKRGVAGDAVKKITALIGASGLLSTQSTNFTTKVTNYKQELEKLDARMTMLLSRYNKQFGAMESLVGQSKSLRTSLESTFEGMMSVYTNK